MPGARLVNCVPGSTEDEAYASHPGPRDPRDRPAAARNGGNVSDPGAVGARDGSGSAMIEEPGYLCLAAFAEFVVTGTVN